MAEMPDEDVNNLDAVVAELGLQESSTAPAEAVRELKVECDQLRFTFDLRWKADMRAIKRWRAAHPGNELVMPDHADLVVWLMEQHDAADGTIERLRANARPKALDWKEPSSTTNGCFVADSVLGRYTVVYEDGWYACLEDGLKWEWEPSEDPRSYLGPYAAQNACQEHFERTIRSALTEAA
jgi:hypothetical protein